MFLARIDGTVTSTVKHPTLEGCRLLIGQRLEAGGEVERRAARDRGLDGRGRGATVLVSTDGDIARKRLGNNTPARLVVVGIVDHVYPRKRRMRLGVVRGHSGAERGRPGAARDAPAVGGTGHGGEPVGADASRAAARR